jgi:hypothetical protein
MTLRAGTLDDTAWLVPVAHIFMRSAQAWDADAQQGSAVACFETTPDDFAPLVKAWRAGLEE